MRIFARTLSIAIICLASLSAKDQATLTLKSAKTCKECHKKRYAEWKNSASTAIYSDDDGKTWNTSKIFAEMGAGEATIAELSDGWLYYNSRAHWNKTKPPKSSKSKFGWKNWSDYLYLRLRLIR